MNVMQNKERKKRKYGLTLFRGDSGDTGSSAARAMLLMAMTDKMHISKYLSVRM